MIEKCQFCTANIMANDIFIFQSTGLDHLFLIKCSRCHATLLVRVFVDPCGIVRDELPTDLSAADILTFIPADELTADDVLKAHDWLKTDPDFIDAVLERIQV